MAIQMRRGDAADFNPAALLPGEWAVVRDDGAYICLSAGDVRRVATERDVIEIVSDAAELTGDLGGAVEALREAKASLDAASGIIESDVSAILAASLGTMTYAEAFGGDD